MKDNKEQEQEAKKESLSYMSESEWAYFRKDVRTLITWLMINNLLMFVFDASPILVLICNFIWLVSHYRAVKVLVLLNLTKLVGEKFRVVADSDKKDE